MAVARPFSLVLGLIAMTNEQTELGCNV